MNHKNDYGADVVSLRPKQQLVLTDLDRIDQRDVGLVEECHKLWLETYKPILEAAGETIHSDGFYRSRLLAAVTSADRLQGFFMSRFLDLRVPTASQSSYFEAVPMEIMGSLISRGARIFSVEWVTVHPSQRAKFTKIQLADLLMGISQRVFLATEYETLMGFSRTDVGADRIAASLGAVPQATISLHGIECRVMIGRREGMVPHRFGVVERAIESLWLNREFRTHELFTGEGCHEQKAA